MSGRHGEAAAALRAALTLDPTDAAGDVRRDMAEMRTCPGHVMGVSLQATHAALGFSLRSAGDTAAAAAAFREALQHNPKQANALAGLASALKASDPAAAAEAFAAASTADEAAVSSAL